MSDREAFLQTIRGALGRRQDSGLASDAPTSAGPLDELEDRARSASEIASKDADNLFDVLSNVAAGAGWNVARVPDPRAAGEYILKLAEDLEARSAVYSLHPVVRDAISDADFDTVGIATVPVALDRDDPDSDEEIDRARLRTLMEAADLGVTGVDYAIAETGTCVIIPRRGVSRLVSLLPPVHVAIVERGQVLPSLDELFTLRRDDFIRGDFGSYMNLITGPEPDGGHRVHNRHRCPRPRRGPHGSCRVGESCLSLSGRAPPGSASSPARSRLRSALRRVLTTHRGSSARMVSQQPRLYRVRGPSRNPFPGPLR